jgi:hypothetical protein
MVKPGFWKNSRLIDSPKNNIIHLSVKGNSKKEPVPPYAGF